MTGPLRPTSDMAGREQAKIVIIGILAVIVGVLAAWLAYGPARLPDAAPHVMAAWTTIGCGLIAWWRVPASRCGPLLVASGMTSFVNDISACLNIEPISHRCLLVEPGQSLASSLGWLWLAILGQAIISFPSGHLASKLMVIAVVVAYASALVMPIEPTLATLGFGIVLFVVPAILWALAVGEDRAERLITLFAGLVLSLALALDLAGLVRIYGLELAVAASSIALLTALLANEERWRLLSVDRAVELGDALAGTLGDPQLRVLFQTPDGWHDATGRSVPLPDDGADSHKTLVEHEGEVIAAILHRAGTLRDDEVREAVVRAVELAAHNVRLRADLDAQVAAVEASRRRLVETTLRERRELGARVDVQVERRLDDLADELAVVRASGAEPGILLHVGDAEEGLIRARTEIDDLSCGLYPRALGEIGLAGALRYLAVRSSLRVQVEDSYSVSGGPEADATIYFLCAEALTNAARHAPASDVRVTLGRAGGAAVRVTIVDEGPGGAELQPGTGLRGLRDRVEALGGHLLIESPPGVGTRLEATIPVSPEALEHG